MIFGRKQLLGHALAHLGLGGAGALLLRECTLNLGVAIVVIGVARAGVDPRGEVACLGAGGNGNPHELVVFCGVGKAEGGVRRGEREARGRGAVELQGRKRAAAGKGAGFDGGYTEAQTHLGKAGVTCKGMGCDYVDGDLVAVFVGHGAVKALGKALVGEERDRAVFRVVIEHVLGAHLRHDYARVRCARLGELRLDARGLFLGKAEDGCDVAAGERVGLEHVVPIAKKHQVAHVCGALKGTGLDGRRGLYKHGVRAVVVHAHQVVF